MKQTNAFYKGNNTIIESVGRESVIENKVQNVFNDETCDPS